MLTNYRKLKEENKKLQKEIDGLKISLACEKKANESLERDVRSLLHIEPNNNFISKSKIRELMNQLAKEDNDRVDYLAKKLGVTGMYPDLTYLRVKDYLKDLLKEN